MRTRTSRPLVSYSFEFEFRNSTDLFAATVFYRSGDTNWLVYSVAVKRERERETEKTKTKERVISGNDVRVLPIIKYAVKSRLAKAQEKAILSKFLRIGFLLLEWLRRFSQIIRINEKRPRTLTKRVCRKSNEKN